MVGGAFNDSKATWLWAFYINLCFTALVALAWLLLILSSEPRPGIKQLQMAKQLEFVGIILFTGSLTSLDVDPRV